MPPPFARQSMTEKDLYFGFMTPEEKAHWEERFANAQNKGLFTPPGLTDTISIPGVNGGPFFWDTGADAANGIVFVQSKDFPSILKMVKAGESTAVEFGRHDSEPHSAGRRAWTRRIRHAAGGPPMALRFGRTVYEGSCQACHGPDLKGDRGPAVDDAVKRLGADAVRNIVKNGKGAMPGFPTMNAEAIADVVEFLEKSEQAPPGTGVPGNIADGTAGAGLSGGSDAAAFALQDRLWPGRLHHYAAVEHDYGVRPEHRQDHVADAVWRYAAGRPERQTARQRDAEERLRRNRRRPGAVCG